jgi:putative ABC transport system ATP-binding protein
MPTDVDLSGSAAVRCARLVKIYPAASGETHALRGVEATFGAGAVTAVTGPSGSGKSSLLGIIALRERQSGGELWLLGDDAARMSAQRRRRLLRRQLAWVAQRPTHSLFAHLTSDEQIEQAARSRTGRPDADPGLLSRLGLEDRARARPAQLSGGEQQRLAVAAAVVGAPALVVVDEPTAELDDDAAALVLAELTRCARAGSAVVVATHDERAVATADRVLHLRHGVLSTERSADGHVTAPIDSTGRLQLPAAAVALFPQSRALVVLDGEGVRLVPPPADDGTGSPV